MTTTAPSPTAAPAPTRSRSTFQIALRRLLRHRAAMVSLGVIVLLVLMAIFAPLLAPYDPNAQNLSGIYAPPSAQHLLGQDDLGRDLLSRVIYGSRVSLMVGFSVAVISILIGTLLGLLAGFFGGLTDSLISRFIEFMLSLPTLPLLLVISGLLVSTDAPLVVNLRSALGASASVIIIITIFSLLGWMGTARLVRGEVLRLKNLEYVDAARALGANNNRIMWRHLVPNLFAVIIVQATLDVGTAILSEAALSFLGFGIQPPVSTWGNMLSNAQEVVLQYPWIPLYPGLAILITVLAFNFLGDGLRDAFDPKSRL
ncbi:MULTISPECIES: ABC transporter permease [Deinococcus]|uniref:ABC-type dipeptide transport system, permease component n=1 Tax=Deinococcus geothermalis (strain DSM 11300 / CIP 105573 / AG-3a) TaxID=319795 RepID=Q1J1K5_DEIGD|nr:MULTISPECIES: ABC transporter permease [Deinococcus]ABF44629.1 ABC-type dipeptide transport system, permease component [Deinococcus geothermalis DSM 11300]TDE84652.1 ABC transporter permease [Deinococcus sp. S9]